MALLKCFLNNIMGLDSYVYAVKPKWAVDDFTISEDIDTQPTEIQYWRRNRLVHQWMNDLYYDKGGTSKPFNSDYVRITKEELDSLEKYIEEEISSDWEQNEWFVNSYSSFFKECNMYLEDGYALYYYSSW